MCSLGTYTSAASVSTAESCMEVSAGSYPTMSVAYNSSSLQWYVDMYEKGDVLCSCLEL